MAVTLKRLVGNAGAGSDESHGTDTLYDVLKALADTQNDMAAQVNQIIADVVTTATDVVPGVEVE
jgi:hypothetical protein